MGARAFPQLAFPQLTPHLARSILCNLRHSRTYKTLAERRFVKEDDPQ